MLAVRPGMFMKEPNVGNMVTGDDIISCQIAGGRSLRKLKLVTGSLLQVPKVIILGAREN